MTFDTRFNIGDEVVFLSKDIRVEKFKVKCVSCTAIENQVREFYYDKDMESHDGRRCFRSVDDLLARVKGGGA